MVDDGVRRMAKTATYGVAMACALHKLPVAAGTSSATTLHHDYYFPTLQASTA